jgi:hypothetical protein
VVFDRESGKAIVIQYPSFPYRLSPDKLMLLLKCLLIIQTLPESALEEASEELEEIYRFYTNRLAQANLPVIPARTIKGKLKATQIRPPIVLEP